MVGVCVVGAGIVGLTTATLLQEALPEASVTIVADGFLQDTVSDVAAGLFRPGLQFQGPSPEVTKKWLKDSYDYYKRLLNSDDAVEAGVKSISGYAFSARFPKIVRNELLEPIADEYRPCTKEELEPFKMKYGSYIVTLLTESRRFMPYLTRKFQRRGGRMVQHHLESLEELADEYDVVCNCTGLGAQDLCGDKSLSPIRGQIYKIRAPWVKHFYNFDYDTYVIPGFDLVTIGGTRQFDSYKEDICKHDAASIWERCTGFLPQLKRGEIVKERVGLRPYRGVVRVEREDMTFDSGKKLKVVHNYGHGGYGVMTAPGTSIHAVSIVKDIIGRHHKSRL